MSWMKRFVYTFVGLILLAIVAVFVLRWWVIGTESGSAFALRQAQGALGDALSIGSQRGSLGDGLTINQLSYRADGTDVQVQNAQITLKLDLLPRPRLVVRQLQLNDVQVALMDSRAETASDTGELPDLASPLPVIVEDLRINNATLTTNSDAEPIVVDSVSAQLEYGDVLNLTQLRIDGNGINARLQAESSLAAPYAHQINLQFNNADSPWLPGLQGLNADIQSTGSLDDLQLTATTDGPLAVQLEGSVSEVLDSPAWDLTITDRNSPLTWPPADAEPEWQADDFSLSTSGSLDDYRAQISAQLSYPQAVSGQWQVAISGDLEQVIIEQLQGPVLQGRITGSGDYALGAAQPEARLALQLQDIKPVLEQPELAALPGVSGTLQLRLDDQMAVLEELNLRVPDTDWRVNGSGRFGLDDEQIDADINWQQINWPPQSGSVSEYTSRQGQLRASGSLSDLAISLSTDISGQAVPAADIDLQGQLRDTGLALEQVVLQTLEGEINLRGQVAWQPSLEWQVDLDAQSINPGAHWNQFPGAIDLQATSNGGQAGDVLDAVVNIRTLDGTLRGQPVSGSGEVRYRDGALRTDGLELRSGDARLELQGDAQALQARLNIPRLREVLPDARGELSADITGVALADGPLTLNNLKLTAAVNGQRLAWQELRAASLELSGQAELTDTALQSDTRIGVTGLELPGRAPIETLEIQIGADPDQQQLSINANRPDTDLVLAMTGRWDQWPGPQNWQGQIQTLRINNQQTGQWRLRRPAVVSIDPGNLVLEPMCIRQTEQASDSAASPGVCLQYRQQPQQQASIELQQLPLALAETFLNIGMRTDLRLSGNLHAGWDQHLERLDGDLQLSTGQVSFLARSTPPLAVQGGRLQLGLTENQRLRSQWQIRIEDSNLLAGDVSYGPVTATEERLSGAITLEMPDLGWLRKIAPELDTIGGQLRMNAALSGPVRQPLVALDIELHNGVVDYQPLGMRLRELELSGHSQPGEILHLTGGFTGGDGRAVLEATLNPDTRVAQLMLTGENVQLLNSEALKMRISPDMRLTASPDGYEIGGELRIPAALIRPPEGTTQRVTESEDVELVGVEQAADDESAPVPVTGQLKVVLGNAVQVDADIAETHLAGELDLVWDHSSIPTANGIIRLVDGRVEAFGQNLDLERSRVVYSDTPADNPRLDIRAVRQIFGDAQVEEAGVAITGTAQEPTIRAYTSPATNEESALAYIATGSNFDHANGQGALNLGLYLLPRLFVSYGVGLFDNGNTANARYEFSEHWNVSVQSGARDTGVDLNWRQDG